VRVGPGLLLQRRKVRLRLPDSTIPPYPARPAKPTTVSECARTHWGALAEARNAILAPVRALPPPQPLPPPPPPQKHHHPPFSQVLAAPPISHTQPPPSYDSPPECPPAARTALSTPAMWIQREGRALRASIAQAAWPTRPCAPPPRGSTAPPPPPPQRASRAPPVRALIQLRQLSTFLTLPCLCPSVLRKFYRVESTAIAACGASDVIAHPLTVTGGWLIREVSAGYYCVGGSADRQPCTAALGYYCAAGSASPEGIQCPAGSYCGGGAADRVACDAAPGRYCARGGSSPKGSICPLGYFCPGGAADRTPCAAPPGGYCPEGSATYDGAPCPAGYFCVGGTSDRAVCTAASGKYCDVRSASPLGQDCPQVRLKLCFFALC
jgi:hypothetical protein